MRSERNVFINIEQKLETEGVLFFSREFTATKYFNAQSVISVPSLHTENVFIFIMVRFPFAKILLLFFAVFIFADYAQNMDNKGFSRPRHLQGKESDY